MPLKPGSFIGKLLLTPEDKHKGEVETTEDGRQVWALAKPFGYVTKVGDEITCPAGMSTDLASIPRWARVGLSPDGPWVRAAVIHDFLYQSQGECRKYGRTWRTRLDPYTRAEADAILSEAMAVLGVGAAQRLVIFSAVRLGGHAGWGK